MLDFLLAPEMAPFSFAFLLVIGLVVLELVFLLLGGSLIGMKVDLARLEAMPGIIAEMVKPAEKIDSIKIHQVSGMGGGGALGGTTANESGKPVVNQALDSILGMAVQLPALKKLGDELGLSMEGGIAQVTSDLMDGNKPPVTEAEVAPQEPAGPSA